MYLLRGLIFSLTLGWGLGSPLLAQQFQGTVKDKDSRNALPGVLVRSVLHPELGVYTDEKGMFSLSVNQGDTIRVSRFGYKAKLVPVRSQNLSNIILLSPKEKQLKTVQIQAPSSIAEDFAIYQLNRLDVYLNPAAKADPLLAVNSLPSATTLDESASVSLRGNSPSATGIFLNQIPLYDPGRFTQLNGIGTFSIFQTELLEKIEVYPGNPPLEYGNSSSGIVALQLPDKVDQSSHSLSLSLASMGAFSANKLGPKVSLTGYGNFQSQEGLKWLNQKSLSDIAEFQSFDAGAYLNIKLNPSATLNLFNYGLRENYTFRFNHPSYDGDFIQDRFRNSHLLNIRVKKNLSTLNFLAGYSRIERSFGVGNIQLEEVQEDIYLATNFYHVGEKFNIKVGINLEPRLGKQDGSIPIFGYALSPENPSRSVQAEEAIVQLEGFSYVKWKIQKKLSLGIGARIHQSLDTSRLRLSRQFHLVYKFSPLHRIHLSGGTYYQRTWEAGRFPMPLNIKSDQLSLDYHYSKKRLTLQTSIYHTISEEQNAEGNSRRTLSGFEAFIEYKLPFKFTGSLTYNSILVHKTTASTKPYDIGYWLRGQISYTPITRLTGSVIFNWREGAENLRVTEASFDQNVDVFRPESYAVSRLPFYLRADANISYIVGMLNGAQLILFASVSNLLNRRNAFDIDYTESYQFDGYNGFSGRVFYMGFVLNWQ